MPSHLNESPFAIIIPEKTENVNNSEKNNSKRYAVPEGLDTDKVEPIGKDGKFGPFEPAFTPTIPSVTTEKKDVYKRGVREAATDMSLAMQVAFTNEQAGVEWYLRQAGMSERQAQIITQIARAAGGMGNNAAMVAQYDFADFVKPGEKGEDCKYYLPESKGRGILQIFNELEELISKKYGLGKGVARGRFYDYLLNLHNISRMSLNEQSVKERAEIEIMNTVQRVLHCTIAKKHPKGVLFHLVQ